MNLLASERNGTPIFWTLMALALGLRLWGIWNVTTTDEYNEVIEALRVCSGHLNFERWGKRFYLYVLAGEYGIFFSIGWLFGLFASPLDFAEKVVRNLEPLFILGRLTSAVAGAASVGVLFKIGERFFHRDTAIFASLLLMLTVFHVDLSQQAKVDATLGLLVLLSLYFLLSIQQQAGARSRDFAWCGLFMALAIQTKINAVVLFVPFGLVLCYLLYDRRCGRMVPAALFFPPAFLTGFVAGNPAVALAPVKFIEDLTGITAVYTTAVNVIPSAHIGFIGYPLYFFRGMGPVVSILAVAALGYSLRHPTRRNLLLLSFLLAFYLLMGASRYLVADYYLIPALPFLYLLIGELLSSGGRGARLRITGTRQSGARVMTLIFLLAMIMPTLEVLKHLRSLSGPNTRYLAKEWIEANLPRGSKILMDSGKSINSFAPPIAENETSLRRILGRAEENIAAGVIVNNIVDRNALIYYRLLLETVPEISYDITSTMFGLEVEDINYYLENGYNYFVISKHLKTARTNPYFARQNPRAAGFYQALNEDERVRLIKIIGPSKVNRGDTFLLYEVQPPSRRLSAEKAPVPRPSGPESRAGRR